MRRSRGSAALSFSSAAMAVAAALIVVICAGVTAGCTSRSSGPSITVFAAASLRPVFTEIAELLKTEVPGAEVEFNFGGSSDLSTQLTQGADGDVFASADTAQMDKVAEAGLLYSHPLTFATNTLVIVTAPGNPKKVAALADLAKPGLAVVVCQQPVPCGVAARQAEELAGVRLNPVSEEPSVTDVLNKVTTGQADAGLVYRTDAISAGDKTTAVEFPEAARAVNTYSIGLLKDSAEPALAQNFIDLVLGERGRKILDAAGFAEP